MLRHVNLSHYDLTLRLTTNPTIRQLNTALRSSPHATDVLSISPQKVYPPHPPPPLAPGVRVLGEVVVSLEYVQRYGGEFGPNLLLRVERLIAHGICHLMGYDHEEDEEWERMDEKEQGMLRAWEEEKKRIEEEQQKKPKRHRRTKAEVLASRQGQEKGATAPPPPSPPPLTPSSHPSSSLPFDSLVQTVQPSQAPV